MPVLREQQTGRLQFTCSLLVKHEKLPEINSFHKIFCYKKRMMTEKEQNSPKKPAWNTRCLVHIKKMDGQHKTLVKTVIRLQQALREQLDHHAVDQLFSDLINRTRIHFQTEEMLMQNYDYPQYENHKRMHDLLLQQIEDSQHTQQAFAQLHHHQAWMGKQELADFLGDWLMSHILDEDNKLGIFLRQQGLE